MSDHWKCPVKYEPSHWSDTKSVWLLHGKRRYFCGALFMALGGCFGPSRLCPQPVVALLRAATQRSDISGDDIFYIAVRIDEAEAMVRVLQANREVFRTVLADGSCGDKFVAECRRLAAGDFTASVCVAAAPQRVKEVLSESGIACSLFEPKAQMIHNMGLPWPNNAYRRGLAWAAGGAQ